MISVFTGLAFTVMVARWLIPAQLGLWEFIIDIMTFASYPVGLIAFWATRDTARAKPVGRTSLYGALALSAGGIGAYFLVTALTYSSVSTTVLPFLLGSFLVPLSYWTQVTNSVVQGYRPGALAYSVIVSEVVKLAIAYPALYVYHLGIDGVIVAMVASYFTQAVANTFIVRGTLADTFDVAKVRRWLSLGWLPALIYLPSIVGISDTFVASLAFGTAIAGYYQAAFLVASIVGYSGSLAYGLYPLLLGGGSDKLARVTIEFSLLFSIPMAAGAAVLAGPILLLLGDKYTAGALGLVILGFAFVFSTVSAILDQVLLGTERVDADSGTTFREYAGSNLLFVPAVNIASTVLYVASMYVALAYAFSTGASVSTTVALWTLSQLAVALITLVVKGARARKVARILPGRPVLYYLFAALVMAGVVYLLQGAFVDRSLDALYYGIRLVALVGVGTGVYLGVLYAIDRGFRDTARSVLRWVRS